MIKKQKGLGRGLETLLGGDSTTIETPAGAPTSLPLTVLQAGKYQPRTRMDEASLNELAASIKAQGLMQPIVVRPLVVDATSSSIDKSQLSTSVANSLQQEVRYEIIAGERRFRASKIAGLTEVPVIVKNVPDDAALAMALIENIQREDLNPLEEAQGIQRLLDEFGMTHEEAAYAVGRSRSATSNLLRLLNLAKPVQMMLLASDLDMGHARALLAVDAATQIQLANQVINKRLSVRETEKLVTATVLITQKTLKSAKAKTPDRDIVRLAEELSDSLGTTVQIKMSGKGKGQMILDFANLDQLDGFLKKLRPIH